ncbi:MAG: hypothetical protein JWQ45_3492 [Blastococcus sp.]|jgi:hypothetical protein|nr:hypothetical protein [Blastococcus sp.]
MTWWMWLLLTWILLSLPLALWIGRLIRGFAGADRSRNGVHGLDDVAVPTQGWPGQRRSGGEV